MQLFPLHQNADTLMADANNEAGAGDHRALLVTVEINVPCHNEHEAEFVRTLLAEVQRRMDEWA